MIFQMGMKMNECSTSVIFNHEGGAEISVFYQKRYWNLYFVCKSVSFFELVEKSEFSNGWFFYIRLGKMNESLFYMCDFIMEMDCFVFYHKIFWNYYQEILVF